MDKPQTMFAQWRLGVVADKMERQLTKLKDKLRNRQSRNYRFKIEKRLRRLSQKPEKTIPAKVGGEFWEGLSEED